MSDNSALVRRLFDAESDQPLPAWPELTAVMCTLPLRRGEALFQAGEPQPYVYVVCRGILKLVYESAEGDAWIKAFIPEERFFASALALSPGGLTPFAAVAVEPGEVVRLDYAVIERLAADHPPWQAMLTRVFRQYGARKEGRERELLTLSAEQRYRRFMAETPALAARLPQKDLARYLGVTPEGLSRIKHRLTGERA